jgi:hypothetical protein
MDLGHEEKGQNHPSGAKSPHLLMGFIGTTEVVPCYKAPSRRVFPQAVKSCPHYKARFGRVFAGG